MTYFDACDSLDDLKAAYKRLALKFHPDCGGDLRTMQEVNAEHDDAFAVLKRERNARTKDPESRVRPTTEAPEEFRAIVEALLKLDGLDVELCGSWLWIGGETYRHRAALKEVWVPEVETVVDVPAHEEPVYGTRDVLVCNACGYRTESSGSMGSHLGDHAVKGVDEGYTSLSEKVQTGTVSVPAQTHEVDNGHYEKVEAGGHWE